MCYLSKHRRGLFEKIVYSRRTTNKDAYVQSLTCIKGILLGNLKVNVIFIRCNTTWTSKGLTPRKVKALIPTILWYVRIIYILFRFHFVCIALSMIYATLHIMTIHRIIKHPYWVGIQKWIFNVLLLELGIIRFKYDEKHRHFLFSYVLLTTHWTMLLSYSCISKKADIYISIYHIIYHWM